MLIRVVQLTLSPSTDPATDPDRNPIHTASCSHYHLFNPASGVAAKCCPCAVAREYGTSWRAVEGWRGRCGGCALDVDAAPKLHQVPTPQPSPYYHLHFHGFCPKSLSNLHSSSRAGRTGLLRTSTALSSINAVLALLCSLACARKWSASYGLMRLVSKLHASLIILMHH